MPKAPALFATLALVMYSSLAIAQNKTPELPLDPESGKIVYTEVVRVDSTLTKNELFSRGREWMAKTFNSATDVIKMEAKEEGKIVGKALFQVYHKAMGANHPSGHINYTVALYFKDGKYKYEFTDFHHTGESVRGGARIADYGRCEDMINTKDKVMGVSYQKTYNYYLAQMHQHITGLAADLKAAMGVKARSDDF